MQGHFKLQSSRIAACISAVLVIANASVWCAAVCAVPPKSASENLQTTNTQPANTAFLLKLAKEARDLQSKNDARGVIRACNQALDIVPNNVDWLMKRADANWRLRRRGLAVEDLSTCIRLKPTAELYEIRCMRYKVMNDPVAALKDIQEAIKLKPVARCVLLKAQLLLEAGDTDGGIAESKRVLTMLETAPVEKGLTYEIEAYEAIGLGYLQKNDPKNALVPLSKALDLTPGWTVACKKNNRAALLKVASWNTEKVLCRGEAYEKLGRLKEAISDYELAVAARPSKNFEYRKSLLRVYRKSGQNEKALALVNQLLQEDDSPDLYYKRAEIYKKLGKTAQAKTDLDRAGNSEYSLIGTDRKLAK